MDEDMTENALAMKGVRVEVEEGQVSLFFGEFGITMMDSQWLNLGLAISKVMKDGEDNISVDMLGGKVTVVPVKKLAMEDAEVMLKVGAGSIWLNHEECSQLADALMDASLEMARMEKRIESIESVD